MESLDYIEDQIGAFVPTADICLKATRHLSKTHRNDLFTSEHWHRRNAEGCFYEALIYEEMLLIVEGTDLLRGLVKKSADVPRRKPNPKLGENGLFYDAMGATVIRGHGQDLGEVDLILVDRESNPIFVEVLISKGKLGGFDREIERKKTLLVEVLGKAVIPFMVISPADLSRRQAVKRIVTARENTFVQACPLEEAKALLDPGEVKRFQNERSRHPKLIDLKAIQVNKGFDYERLHKKVRKLMFRVASGKVSIEGAKNRLGEYPIVSKAILGGLNSSAVEYLSGETSVLIEKQRYNAEEIEKYFLKVVLAIGLPELRPVIYVKVRPEHLAKKHIGTYLKLGPINEETFRFERNVPAFVGFYTWLDSIQPSMEAGMTRNVIETFLREEVVGSRKKKDLPNLKR